MKIPHSFKSFAMPGLLCLASFLSILPDVSAQTLSSQGIGSPALAGTANETNGVFTLEGGGADIAGTSDQFHFVYEALPGDGVMIARVTSVEQTHVYAKAGVMIRENLNANARFHAVLIHANNSVRFQRRNQAGANMVSSGDGNGFPRWLRISRTGNQVSTAHSSDGVNWSSLGSETVTYTGTVYVGLAVCSHNVGQLATAIVDNVTFPSETGGTQLSAFSRIEAEDYSSQSGVQIYTGGSGEKVGSIENNTWIKFEDVDFGGGAVLFKARVASASSGGTIQVKLDSLNATPVGSATAPGTGGWNNFVNVEGNISGATGVRDLYLVFTGGSGALLDLDYFEFQAVASLATADVGPVGIPGLKSENNGVLTIEGSGADIAGTSDQFFYVYRPLPTVGVLTARLASLENTHQYAKAGVMIRESLAPGARHFTTLAHANGGVRFQRRTTLNGQMASSGAASGVPRWLRIERMSDRIVSSESQNGTTWTTIGTEMISLQGNVYIGFAVCSHDNSKLATAVFDSVTFPILTDSDGDQLPDVWETSYGLNPSNPADAHLDGDSDGLTNLQEYWGLTNPGVSNGQTGGTVTIAAITPSAYEIDSTPGKFRLSRTGGTGPASISFTVSGGVSLDDYLLKDPAGNIVTNSILFPSGLNTLDLTVVPVADGRQEYPESLVLTVTPGTGYSVGTTSSAAVQLYDATDIPANEQLFVAHLTPAPGVTENSSGLVQLYLNGPKTSARISITLNSLSSAQTNAYIRWGISGGPGPELRPNLGTGSLNNVVWNVQPIAQATGQDIIDGLYRIGGKYVYVDIGTTKYASGEIQGSLLRRTGSSTFTPPAAPPSVPAVTGNDLTREVARFLTQATFGPTKAEIDQLVNRINTQHGGDRIAGFSAWIDEQLARDYTKHYAYLRASEIKACGGTLPTTATVPLNMGRAAGAAWWTAAMKGHDQLKQRYAFALSEIFVIARSMQPLTTLPAGPVHYYDMLGGHTTGNFRDLLEDVSKHPVMGEYLSHKQNRKAVYDSQGKLISSPDENYAREIMQLFSIGLVGLHPDGSFKLDNTGSLIPTYNNSDIANLARVFTGWSYGMNLDSSNPGTPIVNTAFNAGSGVGTPLYTYYPHGWTHPMRNFASEHDTGSKTFLGATVPAGLDGEADLDAALNVIFAHPNVGPFISRLLIQRLVTSNPSNGYIYRVAQKFENNGSGVRGDMKAVVKAILLDYEARSLSLTTMASYGKQKEPIIRHVQMMRAFNAVGNGALSEIQPYMDAEQYNNYPSGSLAFSIRASEVIPHLGQFPLSAPSVFNWFLPDYSPPGPISAAGLVAPEMNLTTESTTFAVINFFHQMILSYGVDSCTLNFDEIVARYDNLKAGGATTLQATTTLFDELDMLLTAGTFKTLYGDLNSTNPRLTIINSVGSLSEYYTINRVKELVYLITTSPEYVHQR